jgi:hypothetical protein
LSIDILNHQGFGLTGKAYRIIIAHSQQHEEGKVKENVPGFAKNHI